MLLPASLISQFSFVVPIVFRICSNQQFLATKTTSVAFKQHDPPNWCWIKWCCCGTHIGGIRHYFPKKLRFLELPSWKRVPIDDLGSRNLLPIFDSENMASKEIYPFSGLCLSFLFVKWRGFARIFLICSKLDFDLIYPKLSSYQKFRSGPLIWIFGLFHVYHFVPRNSNWWHLTMGHFYRFSKSFQTLRRGTGPIGRRIFNH